MTIHVARDLKLVSIESLKPYERNARTHSDAQIDQIARSIKEFGFVNPILIDGDKGIIAGHGRLAAAKKLKLAQVPVVELSHLTPAQKRAYIIADNKIALNAGWDLELLAAEVASLGGELDDFDAIGFSDQEISDLLAGFEDEIDAAPQSIVKPEPQKPVSLNNVVESPLDAPSSEEVAAEHWHGMPEFKQDDKMPYRTIYVHFENEENAQRFAMLVKQTITEKTKSIWFPAVEKAVVADKVYSGGE